MTILKLKDFLGISNLGQTEFLGYLRTNLCGVTVDSLTASEDYVIIAEFLDSLSERV